MTSTQTSITAEQIGDPTSRAELIAAIDSAPKAGIIHVKGYESVTGHGEVANYTYLKGISYANMKTKSLKILEEIEECLDFHIETVRNAWRTPEGELVTRKAKNRTLVKGIRANYGHGNPLLNDAIQKIRQSLTNPRPTANVYENEGNGIYSHDTGVLHLRDLYAISKKTTRDGDWPVKCQGELVALEAAIRRLLPISHYRQVKLDGRFDYISVKGKIVMQSEDGQAFYQTMSEYKHCLAPRIPEVEQTKTEVTKEGTPVEA